MPTPIIGVDSSGQVKNPPIWMVAVRQSKRRGQKTYAIYLSKEKIIKLAKSIKNWNEKISAALIFKAVIQLYNTGDAIVIDHDFSGKTREYVEKYVKRLFGVRYLGKPQFTNPPIIFASKRDSPQVKEADLKSGRVRHGIIVINEKDPNLTNELKILT